MLYYIYALSFFLGNSNEQIYFAVKNKSNINARVIRAHLEVPFQTFCFVFSQKSRLSHFRCANHFFCRLEIEKSSVKTCVIGMSVVEEASILFLCTIIELRRLLNQDNVSKVI